MIELEEAIDLLVNSVKSKTETERLDILSASGRIAAEDVTALFPVPHFPKSGMDGYAVRSQDTRGASKETPIHLQVIGEICAGEYLSVSAKPMTAVRVMTGALIPEGYDSVIRQEDTDYGKEKSAIYAEVRAGQNYCGIGEDIEAKSLIIPRSTRLEAGHIGVLASMGIMEIEVFQKLEVGIISTGSELVPLAGSLGKVGVYPSSAYALAAKLKEQGAQVTFMEICPDDPELFFSMLDQKIGQADVIITTGALSVGKKDFLPEALEKMGAKRLFHGVNMRPGTPVMASEYKDKLILSLSGYPLAAMVNFQLFFWPVMAKITGDESLFGKKTTRTVVEGSTNEANRRRFVQAFCDEAGVHILERKHHSSVLSGILSSNCIIDQKQGTVILPGETVEILYWK
ncbi:MAG: molybdopterin molybdotransferase MoeA [Lacrimispora sp.]|uniref:molybdopterin molybdotransferase MoeA n=1 Tax=Lacrimispora sp. TaxID=2719234 RepID=UPI0039E55459